MEQRAWDCPGSRAGAPCLTARECWREEEGLGRCRRCSPRGTWRRPEGVNEWRWKGSCRSRAHWQSAMAKGSPAPPRGKEVALETGPRGRLERGPRERVLEEVLLGAVVEQVAHFDVDPERPGHAQAGACIDADLGGQLGGAVRVPW